MSNKSTERSCAEHFKLSRLGPVIKIVAIFSSLCYYSKKENKKIQHQRYRKSAIDFDYFLPRNGTIKKKKNDQTGNQAI